MTTRFSLLFYERYFITSNIITLEGLSFYLSISYSAIYIGISFMYLALVLNKQPVSLNSLSETYP